MLFLFSPPALLRTVCLQLGARVCLTTRQTGLFHQYYCWLLSVRQTHDDDRLLQCCYSTRKKKKNTKPKQTACQNKSPNFVLE